MLVIGARTVLDVGAVLGWAVGVLGGWGEAGFVGLLGGGPAASMLVPCVDHQACWWSWSVTGAIVGQELCMLGGSLLVIAGGLHIARPESA